MIARQVTERPARWLLIGRLVALVSMVVGCSAGGQASNPPRTPPPPVLGAARTVFDGDLGDPFILKDPHGPNYVVFGTGTPPWRIPTATSDDLLHWREGPDAFPILPSWSSPDPDDARTWAPAVMAIGNRFVMFLTVPDARSGRPCIAVATSTLLAGPYTDALGGPLVCQPELGGSIDPSVTRQPGGALTLLWKSNGTDHDGSALWSADLRPDGLAVVGVPHHLLGADRPWQRGVVEEPAAVPATAGGWWLFYSGDSYDQPGYSIGVAWCRVLSAPCVETSDQPVLRTVGKQLSPGGLEVFRSVGGSPVAVFDTWSRPPRNGRYYCCRSLDIAQLRNL
jgi:hypothetical protein